MTLVQSSAGLLDLIQGLAVVFILIGAGFVVAAIAVLTLSLGLAKTRAALQKTVVTA